MVSDADTGRFLLPAMRTTPLMPNRRAEEHVQREAPGSRRPACCSMAAVAERQAEAPARWRIRAEFRAARHAWLHVRGVSARPNGIQSPARRLSQLALWPRPRRERPRTHRFRHTEDMPGHETEGLEWSTYQSAGPCRGAMWRSLVMLARAQCWPDHPCNHLPWQHLWKGVPCSARLRH